MKKLLALILCSWAKDALAGGLMLLHAGGIGGAGSTYVGPGDAITPQARAWYGLRGYNRTYATPGTNHAIGVAVGASSFNVNILSSGNLDVATALTVGGTGSCTIASTTMSCATGTGTLDQFGNIAGAGLVMPAFVSGSGCSTFPCTVTLNQSQTVAVAETITSYTAIQVQTWNDQSGANACSGGPCNVSKVGIGVYLINNCQNSSLPCTIDTSSTAYNVATGMTSTNIPVTFSVVGARISNTTSFMVPISINDLGGNQPGAFWTNSTNTVAAYAGSFLTGTAADGSAHSMQFVSASGACVTNVDGTETGPSSCGAGAASTKISIITQANGTNPMQGGYFMEAGMWPSGLVSGDRTALCHNERLYWTTGGSC